MQLQLFPSSARGQVKDRTEFSDPNFASNKGMPVHRWVPWIAGFSSNFVRGVIQDCMSSPGTVLDPFAGVGTTLVEATWMGHDVIGFEINPYAANACSVKVNARKIPVSVLDEEAVRLRAFCKEALVNGYEPKARPPAGFRTRKEFYSPTVLRKVLIVQDFIEEIASNLCREVFRIAFASTMIRYSNYSYEPSLGTRAAAGRDDVDDYPVMEVVLEKVQEIIADVQWLLKEVTPKATAARIINASFFDCRDHVQGGLADLAITSPPYLNNYHYIRNTRPHLYWLGYAQKPEDTKSLEQENFGKYWQTVRDLQSVQLDFPDPPGELTDLLCRLRTKNAERGAYGGCGWANYAAAYFNDCYRFTQGLHYVLRPGGAAFVVIGNSILQGEMVPTDVLLAEIAQRSGLEIVGIHVPRATRVGNSIIQSDVRVEKADSSHRLYESVVQLRVPK